jgi:hypothetical protein
MTLCEPVFGIGVGGASAAGGCIERGRKCGIAGACGWNVGFGVRRAPGRMSFRSIARVGSSDKLGAGGRAGDALMLTIGALAGVGLTTGAPMTTPGDGVVMCEGFGTLGSAGGADGLRTRG